MSYGESREMWLDRYGVAIWKDKTSEPEPGGPEPGDIG